MDDTKADTTTETNTQDNDKSEVIYRPAESESDMIRCRFYRKKVVRSGVAIFYCVYESKSNLLDAICSTLILTN